MEAIPSISTQKRCAVVTGGNKGIGLEICRQLASNGILVILTARDEKRGIEAVESLKASGLSDVVFHQLDIKDSSSVASLANFVHTHFKKLDILVNNAADGGLFMNVDAFRALPHGFDDVQDSDPDMLKGILEQTYDKAEECIKTNYYGTKAVTEALLPFLQVSNSANIVNVSSAYGLLMFIHSEKVKEELNNVESLTEERLDELFQWFLKDFKEDKLEANGWPITVSAYKMSKAAVNAYTRMLARKFPNMRINCVHPGYVKTDMTCNTGLLTAEEGAKGPVKLALLPENGPSGQYFNMTELSDF
ncbi:Salutaridine reductase [Thalictrum thalictroides]|uniref:Short-chain dehydrogenase/reductase n=1 Tax=Thalictrum thalictroides TaxID=46969 RepID=A0A7J6W2Q8_THATH|nr:Salutaridine reductase [Thalictrum thalictroides]